MKKYLSFKYIKENFYIITISVVAFILRFFNLGYSDFQGDEIKALYLPAEGESFFSYIIDQRKGPVQFIVTYILKIINPSYDNQFLLRLPFAVAGFFAVIFFYRLVKLHFGEKIAFYSSIFFATNGFLIAFSRIIQYQSFVVLFMVLSLYFFSLAGKDKKYTYSGVYLGFIYWALSILSHYDGVFIAPLVFYLLFSWSKNERISRRAKLTTFIISGLIAGVLLLSFYVPFILSISDSTKEYWAGRISGDVSGKISSSRYLFAVYHPIYVIHIYTVLFVLGVALMTIGLLSKYILKIKNLPDFARDFFTHSTDLMNMIQDERFKIYSILVWFCITVAFFEVYVYIPGTHIYTYLIPLFIILSFGLVFLESVVFKVFEFGLVRIFNFLGLLTLFLFLSAQSYAVFVDNTREYPWEEENFLIWRFPKPSPIFHLSMFGFPYFRDWEGIRDFLLAHPEVDAYSTNERVSISRYYIGLDKGSEKAGFYIHVKEPQSFTGEILDEKALYWSQHYEPVYTLTRFGRDMVRVYIMEPGSLEDIIKEGY